MTTAVARGGLRALALAALVPAVSAAGASAHVTIAPSASRPGDLQRYHVLVPNESQNGKSTIEIDVQLPSGITFVLADYKPPWRAKLVRSNGEIREIRWTRGAIPPDGYGELAFIARNPVRQGEALFKTLQRYEGGQVTRWIGAKDSDNPSPAVQLSEAATPVDVVSVHGEKVPTASSTAKAAPATSGNSSSAEDDGDGKATVALIAGLLGAALGAAALVTSRWRRTGP